MTNTEADLPVVNAEAIDAVFSMLSRMEVILDEDPLQFGPKRLNGKVAEARRMLTECESIFLKVSQWLQKYRAAHRTLEVEFDLEKKHLYANDPEVRAGRNVADREALATMKLREQAQELSRLAQTQSDLEAVMSVIKAKRSDLKDAQSRLRDQIKLCQEEIGLGGKWGTKPSPGSDTPDLDHTPDVDKQTLKDLHEMFTGTGPREPDFAAVVDPIVHDGIDDDDTGGGVVDTTPHNPDGSTITANEGATNVPNPEPESDLPLLDDEGSSVSSDDDAEDFLSEIPAAKDADEEGGEPRPLDSLLDDLDL